MNNKYFFSAICLTILACAPACCKKQKPAPSQQEEVRTMIELDNTVFEVETENKESINKF